MDRIAAVKAALVTLTQQLTFEKQKLELMPRFTPRQFDEKAPEPVWFPLSSSASAAGADAGDVKDAKEGKAAEKKAAPRSPIAISVPLARDHAASRKDKSPSTPSTLPPLDLTVRGRGASYSGAASGSALSSSTSNASSR